jgi:hypothetical protein
MSPIDRAVKVIALETEARRGTGDERARPVVGRDLGDAVDVSDQSRFDDSRRRQSRIGEVGVVGILRRVEAPVEEVSVASQRPGSVFRERETTSPANSRDLDRDEGLADRLMVRGRA